MANSNNQKPKARSKVRGPEPSPPTRKRPPKAPPAQKAASREPRVPQAPTPKTGARKRVTKKAAVPAPAADVHAPLTDEEQISSAKYLSGTPARRLFEEERFLFPESYGTDRVRLLVKDPEWLFAYWDVDPRSLSRVTSDLGERSAALARLTLKVTDPANGGSGVVLLPPGARTWYIRTDSARRSYRAELGVTLPSGEFRRLAVSNVVVAPRVGASPERASRKVTYREAREISREMAVAAGATVLPVAPGPWVAPRQMNDMKSEAGRPGRGGASDAFRR